MELTYIVIDHSGRCVDVSGLLVLGFGVYGLINAASLGGKLWQGVVGQV